MGAKENKIINDRLANLADNERLFRSNAGLAWSGELVTIKKRPALINIRRINLLPEGFPDMFGWRTVEITDDMVGQKVAIFQAEEVKVTGDLRREQRIFKELLLRMGGLFKVIR